MLSSRKSQIGITEIDFLRMHFTQGKYVPQPHIAEEFLKFPNENMSANQIQQFLGILNSYEISFLISPSTPQSCPNFSRKMLFHGAQNKLKL